MGNFKMNNENLCDVHAVIIYAYQKVHAMESRF